MSPCTPRQNQLKIRCSYPYYKLSITRPLRLSGAFRTYLYPPELPQPFQSNTFCYPLLTLAPRPKSNGSPTSRCPHLPRPTPLPFPVYFSKQNYTKSASNVGVFSHMYIDMLIRYSNPMVPAFINFIFTIPAAHSEGYSLGISIQSYSNFTSDNLL